MKKKKGGGGNPVCSLNSKQAIIFIKMQQPLPKNVKGKKMTTVWGFKKSPLKAQKKISSKFKIKCRKTVMHSVSLYLQFSSEKTNKSNH